MTTNNVAWGAGAGLLAGAAVSVWTGWPILVIGLGATLGGGLGLSARTTEAGLRGIGHVGERLLPEVEASIRSFRARIDTWQKFALAAAVGNALPLSIARFAHIHNRGLVCDMNRDLECLAFTCLGVAMVILCGVTDCVLCAVAIPAICPRTRRNSDVLIENQENAPPIFRTLGHHSLMERSESGHQFILRDGSCWNVDERDREKVLKWKTNDQLILTQNNSWFSNTPLKIVNKNTGNSAAATIFLEDLVLLVMRILSITSYEENGRKKIRLRLTNGSEWKISRLDHEAVQKQFRENDAIIIGMNSSLRSRCQHILFNYCPFPHAFVRAQLVLTAEIPRTIPLGYLYSLSCKIENPRTLRLGWQSNNYVVSLEPLNDTTENGPEQARLLSIASRIGSVLLSQLPDQRVEPANWTAMHEMAQRAALIFFRTFLDRFMAPTPVTQGRIEGCIELDDGSFWQTDPADASKLSDWRPNHRLMIGYDCNNTYLSVYGFKITNQSTRNSVAANPIYGPIDSVKHISSVNIDAGELVLSGGSSWKVSRLHQEHFAVHFSPGHVVQVGENIGADSHSEGILFNWITGAVIAVHHATI